MEQRPMRGSKASVSKEEAEEKGRRSKVGGSSWMHLHCYRIGCLDQSQPAILGGDGSTCLFEGADTSGCC
jgi:hypothetical protein